VIRSRRNKGQRSTALASRIDLSTAIGSVELANPVMTASGTAGHGAELDAYFPLRTLGAHVVKSLSAEPWPGNPAPRVHATTAGMLNSVGLQGPGIEHWLAHDLPKLERCGARTVVSIWGRTVDDYKRAAHALSGVPLVAIEVNLSCPNLDGGKHLFAQSGYDTAAAIEAVTSAVDLPVWAKLTAQVSGIVEIAAVAHEAGAAAVTVTNTLLGMAIDPDSGRYRIGSGAAGAGLSGPAIHPVAVRAVHDVHVALPDLPIVGVGGVASAADAVELLLAGASAIQVGTATFADPRAAPKVLEGLEHWCARHAVARVREIIGGVHD
jgi:dihydroorotate dehydrogenase (NAD+) catalytic subunit